MSRNVFLAACLTLSLTAPLAAQTNTPDHPTWWEKYQPLLKNGPALAGGATTSSVVGANVDVSNECGPQSETFITLNPSRPRILAAGSNEIFRLPMRGYFSSDGGAGWGGVDLPLPPPVGANGIDFGSDPTLAFDTRGNVFYGYIIVFFSKGFAAINATGMAGARPADGSATHPSGSFLL